MKPSNPDLQRMFETALQRHSTSVTFESARNPKLNNRRGFTMKKAVAIPLILIITLLAGLMVGFAGSTVFRNIDRTDYPFINDWRVIGKWDSVDFVATIDDFNPAETKWQSSLYLASLVFIKEGKMLAANSNGNLAYTSFSWTRDLILNKTDKTASNYQIKEINGTTYLFFEWKSGDYVFRNMKPYYYVLKKVDSKDYSNLQPVRVKEDFVDDPFVDDVQMKGKWESVDFVRTIESFVPGEKGWLGDLYLLGLNLGETGVLTFTTTSGQYTHSLTSYAWTKGLILNKVDKTASKCEIREISGTTYMFYEWKSGDYVFRGMQPWYYVLKKIK